MLAFIIQRIFWLIPTMLIISVISFVIIQLPPGDYLTSHIAALEESGQQVDYEQVEQLRKRYNLDRPIHIQYLGWMAGLMRGDMGMSFEANRPVKDLIGERLMLTMIISFTTLLFTWVLAIPIGIYSAVKQYSWGDYTFTFIGFIGLAVPNFLLALIFVYVGFAFFGLTPGALMAESFEDQPWSLAKIGSFCAHLWIPVLIIGTSGAASLIRVMRGNLLDELRKQYVITARAKGLLYWKLLLKYPVRVALNPLVSKVGWLLPTIVSGEIIVSIVLGFQTTGPLLLQALLSQDMYLAGSIVMMLSLLTVFGTVLSDILLMWLDPRIRYDKK